MNNNEQTLEMQIKTKSEEAVKSLDKLISLLTGIEKSVNNIDKAVSKSDVSKVTKDIDLLDKNVQKATSNTDKLKKALSFGSIYLGTKKITNQFLEWMNESVDFTEQLNLFNVVFKNVEKDGVKTFSALGKEASRFQYQLNEAFGTNKTQTLYTQGIFQSMGENVGIAGNYSAIMSETMTKLTYDLASLYNKSEKTTAEAIRAGVYAGQTKPLRSFGIDVTQMSMQPVLNDLGITDRSVKQMSQAEKEILRYITTLNQAKVAMGDFTNTIESPSNQMKIFKQQLVETKVALSSLFMGTFANILPYVNAFLMVVKEISRSIADMFGIKLSDYNTGIGSQGDAFEGLEDSVGGATDAIKEFKRQSLGFDQIHNISENKDSGSSSASGSAVNGGIDQRLLDAIKGYDNGMESVRMKASQIRDNIMEWLGFTKEINPLTGEISFKLGEGYTNFKKIINLIKVGGIIATVGNLYSIVSKFYSPLNKTFSSVKKFQSLKISGSIGIITTAIALAIVTLKDLYDSSESYRKQVSKLKDNIVQLSGTYTKLFKTLEPLVSIFNTIWSILEGMIQINFSGITTAITMISDTVNSLLTLDFSGWFDRMKEYFGNQINVVQNVIDNLTGYNDAIKSMVEESDSVLVKANDSLKKYYSDRKAIEDSMNNSLTEIGFNEKLLEELDLIVDANGKVKKGYEDRANFILNELNNAFNTEYKIIDGTISGYDEIYNSIQDIIQAKKTEIILDAEKENYLNAINSQANAWKLYNEALGLYNKNNEKANELLNKKNELESIAGTNAFKNYQYTSELTKETYHGMVAYQEICKELNSYNNEVKKNIEAIDESGTVFGKYTNDITFYENLQTAVLTNNVNEQNRLINERVATITTANGEEKLSLSEQLRFYEDISKRELETLKKNGVEITDEMTKQSNSQLELVIKNLKDQSSSVENLTPEIVEAWATLGKQNKDKFLENFKTLPSDIQTQIVNKMQEQGHNISSELQKGIEQIKPEIHIGSKVDGATIKIDADTSEAKKKTDNWLSTLFEGIGSFLGIKKETGGTYSNGLWKDIPQYANGGSPTHGTMFVAGENGAEIVGHINRKTEVLNQSQIASAIYSAVVNAMSQYGGGGVAEINIHADKGIIVETAVDGIQQHVNQTGSLPFTIPMK